MDHYVGLDVSLKETHFCVVDGAGEVVSRGRDATQPAGGNLRNAATGMSPGDVGRTAP